jgi:hypothetical protein
VFDRLPPAESDNRLRIIGPMIRITQSMIPIASSTDTRTPDCDTYHREHDTYHHGDDTWTEHAFGSKTSISTVSRSSSARER